MLGDAYRIIDVVPANAGIVDRASLSPSPAS